MIRKAKSQLYSDAVSAEMQFFSTVACEKVQQIPIAARTETQHTSVMSPSKTQDSDRTPRNSGIVLDILRFCGKITL